MGCVTDRIQIAYDMYEKGVPVWLVRPPSQIPDDINIIDPWFPTKPAQAGVVVQRWSGAPIFYQGPLSREIHLSIYKWKPGQANLTRIVDGDTGLVPVKAGSTSGPALRPGKSATAGSSKTGPASGPVHKQMDAGKHNQRGQPCESILFCGV